MQAQQACHLTLLPSELLTAIVSHFALEREEDQRRWDVQDDALALLNLMKTCRTLYAIAKPILYHTPPLHRPSHGPKYETRDQHGLRSMARCFVETIQSDDVAALSVRSLASLRDLLWAFNDIAGVPNLQRIAQVWHEEAVTIQTTLLRSCPNIEAVTIGLSDLTQAATAGRQLASLAQLKDLDLYVGPPPPARPERDSDGDLVRACLAHFAPRRAERDDGIYPLATLSFKGTEDVSLADNDTFGATLRGMASNVQIDCRSAPPHAIERYLVGLFSGGGGPGSLHIYCTVPRELGGSAYDTAGALTKHLTGHRLTTFRLGIYVPRLGPIGSLSDYRWHSDDPYFLRLCYSESFFGSFPLASELELPRGRHMTLAKLRQLAHASPELVKLDMDDTLWDMDPESLEVDDDGGLSAFETELVQILETMNGLERIDLGIWPYVESRGSQPATHRRFGLQDWADENGIELIVMGFHADDDDSDSEANSGVRPASLGSLPSVMPDQPRPSPRAC